MMWAKSCIDILANIYYLFCFKFYIFRGLYFNVNQFITGSHLRCLKQNVPPETEEGIIRQARIANHVFYSIL